MRDAVVVAAARTPVGKRRGALSDVHPADLSASVLSALGQRVDLDPGLVDDVVWGCVSQVGEQTFDIARTAVLSAGWPESVPGTTVDRQCGSSQQAIHFAAAGVISGQYDVAVAGGVESMSRVPMGSAAGDQSPLGELYEKRYGEGFPNQGLGRRADRPRVVPGPCTSGRIRGALAPAGGDGRRRRPTGSSPPATARRSATAPPRCS
jgi:acetyl-CoA acyltransferase